MDERWVGVIDHTVATHEKDIELIKQRIDTIRKENIDCRTELKADIHNIAKWRERVIVYLMLGALIGAYAIKRILDLYIHL